MATIQDVAAKAGVSTATVSAVLNGTRYVSPELTKRVQDAVDELDYSINLLARGLLTRSTGLVGMVVPGVHNPFYADIVTAAEQAVKKEGCSLLMGVTHHQTEELRRYLSLFSAMQVEGLLIILAPDSEDQIRKLARKGKPVVLLGRAAEGLDVDAVVEDHGKAIETALRHLLNKGHRCIGLISPEFSFGIERIAAWRKTLEEANCPVDDCYLYRGDLSAETGRRAALRFLALDRKPTAILAAGVLNASGAVQAMRTLGLDHGANVEIMTAYDNQLLDGFTPPISSIVHPAAEMGTKAVELLVKRIRDPKRPVTTHVLDAKLKIRTP